MGNYDGYQKIKSQKRTTSVLKREFRVCYDTYFVSRKFTETTYDDSDCVEDVTAEGAQDTRTGISQLLWSLHLPSDCPVVSSSDEYVSLNEDNDSPKKRQDLDCRKKNGTYKKRVFDSLPIWGFRPPGSGFPLLLSQPKDSRRDKGVSRDTYIY